jgi:cytochrome c5
MRTSTSFGWVLSSTTSAASLSIFLGLAIAAAPPARADASHIYRDKCLYCHSSDLVQTQRLRVSQWRKVVERMRSSAPLLISRSDAEVILRYLVRDLKLIPKEEMLAKAAPRSIGPTGRVPAPVARPEPTEAASVRETEKAAVPVRVAESDWAAAPAVDSPSSLGDEKIAGPTAEELALEQEGTRLIEERCSKCHTLYRVFTKLGSADAVESIIERMRKKTGSGISPDDVDTMRRFAELRLGQ